MKQRSAEIIRSKFYDGKWRCHRELKLVQEQLGDEILFETLFGIFLDDRPDIEKRFQIQQKAGHCLLKLMPKCNRDLKGMILDSLKLWNRSVEELPWYFYKIFGKETVLSTIGDLERKQELSDDEFEKLKTYKFWLSANNEYLDREIETRYRL